MTCLRCPLYIKQKLGINEFSLIEEWLKELKNSYMKYHKAIKNKFEPYQFIWRAFHKILLRKNMAR